MPGSWMNGIAVAGATAGCSVICWVSIRSNWPVGGRSGGITSPAPVKSKALVKSPLTARCQGEIAGTTRSKRRSRNWATEV
ncbi:hypothetical protein D3C80_842740 [compost metagenome]